MVHTDFFFPPWGEGEGCERQQVGFGGRWGSEAALTCGPPWRRKEEEEDAGGWLGCRWKEERGLGRGRWSVEVTARWGREEEEEELICLPFPSPPLPMHCHENYGNIEERTALQWLQEEKSWCGEQISTGFVFCFLVWDQG